ncbi:hypothetical protein BH23BAC4_BH23BAC4_01880 [soil metagenome]
MTKSSRRDFVKGLGAGAVVLTLNPSIGFSQDWPRRPITIVIQYAEGGGTDTIIRGIRQALERKLGVSIRAVNQPGAVGAIATQYVAARPADGLWLLGGAEYNKFFRVLGHTDEAPWKTWQFFKIGTSVPAWGVRPDSPYESLADVIADAKSRPGEVKISNAGIGSIWHEATLVALEQATGATFTHVPYDGGAPAALAALQGEVDVVASGVHEQIEFVRAGQLRNLAVFRDAPLEVEGLDQPLTPVTDDIPTAADVGLIHGVYAIAAKRDTDRDILLAIQEAVRESVADPQFASILHQRVMFPEFKGGEEADREAALFESVTSWVYWDEQMEGAVVDPETLGIPRPEDFASWWPPEDYEPVL